MAIYIALTVLAALSLAGIVLGDYPLWMDVVYVIYLGALVGIAVLASKGHLK